MSKILIVDDNDHVLRLLKISLEKAGYEVFTAINGDDGLARAKDIIPDLIVSDVMMPSTDGIEFCWMIRENSPIPMVPFIFLTSLEDQEIEIRGFRAGADEYLIKPVERKILLEKVSALLERANRVKSIDGNQNEEVKGFEGNLADLSLAEVIQLLSLNRRDGVLHIEAKNDKGEIFFHNGQMTYGKYGDIYGEQAIYKVVPVNTGKFHFEPGFKEKSKNIHGSTMNLLIEACRLEDEENFKS